MKTGNTSLVWKEKTKKALLQTVVMTVTETESIAPDGKIGHYIVMDAPDWVITVPVTGDSFLMVEQWRHGEQALSMEFPGGVIEKNEDPKAAAARELSEETGYTAGQLVELGCMNPNPALMSNHVHIYAAFDLKKTKPQQLDSDEYVNFMQIKQSDVFEQIGTKKYPHALMAAALALYRNYIENNKK
ncbi:MAG: NUDIX hydrolase [Treponema sp.]|nr:NUDIX hydrolase [Treponema sp.]